MRYSDKIPISDIKLMAEDKGMLKNYMYDKFLNTPPPDFVMSYKEVLYLKSIPMDDCYVEHYDNIESIFLNYFQWDDDIKRLVKQLISDSAKIIMVLKWHYNRIRPYQLAEKTNLDFETKRLYSMESPSYPSGHSTQAWLLATYLGHKFPEQKQKLEEIAQHISNSRLVAKCHYPSDTEVGKLLGLDMANHLVNFNPIQNNETVPFQEEIHENHVIRKFTKDLSENELKWHFDVENRTVIPLNENDWQFQFDNELPQAIDKTIFTPEGKYHRVIKGTTDLIVKIIK
jgi:hypothetical protein